jgi:hypothetical protein
LFSLQQPLNIRSRGRRRFTGLSKSQLNSPIKNSTAVVEIIKEGSSRGFDRLTHFTQWPFLRNDCADHDPGFADARIAVSA